MKSYIELTLTEGTKILVPLGRFMLVQGPRWVSIRMVGNGFYDDVKESMKEIKDLIRNAEEYK